MGSHFSAIGIVEELQIHASIEAALEHGTPVAASGAQTFKWNDESGAGLWVHATNGPEIECVTPVFRSDRRHALRFDGFAADEECRFCSGAQFAVVEEGEMVFPFVMQLADAMAVVNELPQPGTLADLSLTAFGEKVRLFEDEEAFSTAGTEDEIQFAAQSFIPAGMFGGDPASAIINGIVRSADRRTNGVTGHDFWAVVVETFGFTIDVVVDVEDLESAPTSGNVLGGEFWMCGSFA